MWTPIALFVGLLIASAFIARLSDDMGKKLGKKRISVLGLRPRTSASVITIASSWAIMLVTLLALLITVTPLKSALFSIDRVQRDLKLKLAQLTLANAQVEQAKQQTQRAQQQAQQAQQQAAHFQSISSRYQQQASVAQASAARANANLQKVNLEFGEARRGEQAARQAEQNAKTGQQQAQQQADNARRDLERATSELTEKKAQVGQVQQKLIQANQHLARSQKRLASLQERLTSTQSKLTSSHTQLVKSYKQLLASYREVIAAQNQVAELQKTEKTLRTQIGVYQKQLASLNNTASVFGIVADVLAKSDIALPVGQTLAERRIDPTPSIEQMKKELGFLMDAAQAGANQFVPHAEVIPVAIDPNSPQDNPKALSKDEIIAAYARALATTSEPVSARLVSTFNYPRDAGAVFTSFLFVPVRTIYNARETISEGTVDASRSESKIFSQLQYLVDKARFEAERRGSKPSPSPDSPNFFDGDTGSKMFDTLHQLQRIGRPVRVRIIAAQDVTTTDPIPIRFQIGDSVAPGAKNTA